MASVEQVCDRAPHATEIPSEPKASTWRWQLEDVRAVLLAASDSELVPMLADIACDAIEERNAFRLVLTRATALLHEQDQEIDRLRARRLTVATAA